MPEMGTMQQINSEPLHMGTMHQLNPEPLHMGTILTPQSQAEQYAREAKEAAAEAAQSATDAQTAAESAQQVVAGAVKYSEAQTLTAAQQAQARANIGAADAVALAAKQDAPAIAGTEGQVLTIDDQGDPVWATPTDAVSRQEFDALAEDVDWKAPAIIASAGPADIVSVTDGAEDAPVKSLVVGIEPVQDLHGYDHPWPAGGGVNILDPNLKFTAGTYYGGLVITTSDGYNITLSGTPAESGNVTTNIVPTADAVVYPAGTYTSTGGIFSTYKPDGSWYTNRQTGTWTADSDFIVKSIYIQAVAGQSVSGSRFISLAKGSTAPTAWTPYSNICPITGWTGANVTRAGKNLLDDSIKTVFGSRLLIGATSVYNNPTYLKAGTYSITVFGVNQTFAYLMKSTNALKTIANGTNHGSFTVDNDGYYRIDLYGNIAISGDVTGVILVPGSTYATAYEPYTDQTYDITLPSEAGTVYGGTLDVISGELTVDRAYALLNNPNMWESVSSTVNYQYTNDFPNRKKYDNSYTGLSCSYMTVDTNRQNSQTARWTGAMSNTFGLRWVGGTLEQVKADAAEGKIEICYELATPIVYHLTPIEVRTILGANNIWADAGPVSVEYTADTKMYIDSQTRATRSLIAGIETTMTASRAYAAGDLLIVGDILYKAAASIASGATLTPGTNVTHTTVAEQLILLANA